MIDNEDVVLMTGPGAIARLCREQGRTKGWVAAQLGITPSRLSKLIAGAVAMRVDEAAKAALLFGVPIETFVPRIEAAS
jgi:plasmid maintenance system antidote protein VapI